ncbi:unnamed protein product [Ranitomeya imitator]|uniref:Reverse transcriptase domain-containing protein n=1 Tax=Ranitomeya imitator TaxID=111125 RepID=A0ABN9KWW1_9NEOB|nr:unnamed protein product [Ranitomeya imitator]
MILFALAAAAWHWLLQSCVCVTWTVSGVSRVYYSSSIILECHILGRASGEGHRLCVPYGSRYEDIRWRPKTMDLQHFDATSSFGNMILKEEPETPIKAFNGFQLDQELQRFFRNLRLKAHFATVKLNSITDHSDLSSNSSKSAFSLKELDLSIPSPYNPPKSYHPVETYISLVTQDIQRECAQINLGLLPIKRNCTTLEKRALDNLKNNNCITIKPADKGGAIVVMETSFYLSMVHQHLDDRNTYLPVDRDPTGVIFKEIQQKVKAYGEQNVIDSKLSEFLLHLHPVVPIFYALPKIHKHQTRPPGRPIARTVEKILTPLLVYITSFIRDTSDFLEGLKSVGILQKDCFLVTMDFNSLYTSIDHAKGLEAVQWFLDMYTCFSSIQKDFCLTLLKLILTKNFFLFADQFYIQRVGTAMGSNVVPPYANIFMAFFEENFVYTHCLFQQHCIYWKIFIDDVFFNMERG